MKDPYLCRFHQRRRNHNHNDKHSCRLNSGKWRWKGMSGGHWYTRQCLKNTEKNSIQSLIYLSSIITRNSLLFPRYFYPHFRSSVMPGQLLQCLLVIWSEIAFLLCQIVVHVDTVDFISFVLNALSKNVTAISLFFHLHQIAPDCNTFMA